jgi:hypothetical protein
MKFSLLASMIASTVQSLEVDLMSNLAVNSTGENQRQVKKASLQDAFEKEGDTEDEF